MRNMWFAALGAFWHAPGAVSGCRFSRRGFTLIEMLIVLGIIAILLLFAVPLHNSTTGREQVEESLKLLEVLKPRVEAYYAAHGYLPVDNAAAGLPLPDKLIGNYVTGIQLSQGGFHLQFGNKAHGLLRDRLLSVRAVIVAGSPLSPLSWVCGYSPVPAGMTAPADNRTTVGPALLPVPCRELGSGSK